MNARVYFLGSTNHYELDAWQYFAWCFWNDVNCPSALRQDSSLATLFVNHYPGNN